MGRKHSTVTTRRPQASKRERSTIVTPWHEAGIETLESYSRTVRKDQEGWR